MIQATINQSHSLLGYITKKVAEKSKDISQESSKIDDNKTKEIVEKNENLSQTLKVEDKEIKEISGKSKEPSEETSKLDDQKEKEILEKVSQESCQINCDNESKDVSDKIKEVSKEIPKVDANEAPSEPEVYQAFLLEFARSDRKIHVLETEKSKQIRIQFLYREKDQRTMEKFLLLVHQECEYKESHFRIK